MDFYLNQLISQVKLTDIYILLAILGASCLYFGKLISDTKPTRYDKVSLYIEGLVFIIIFLLLPMAVIYFLFAKFNLQLPDFYGILIQLALLTLLSYNVMAHIIRQYNLLENIGSILSLREKDQLVRIVEEELQASLPVSNKYVLFFISFVVIWINVSILSGGISILVIFSFILSFFIFSMMAISYGYGTAKYPTVKITLKDGKVSEGKFLKYDGEFFKILVGGKEILINKNEMITMETSVTKSNEAPHDVHG